MLELVSILIVVLSVPVIYTCGKFILSEPKMKELPYKPGERELKIAELDAERERSIESAKTPEQLDLITRGYETSRKKIENHK